MKKKKYICEDCENFIKYDVCVDEEITLKIERCIYIGETALSVTKCDKFKTKCDKFKIM